MTAQSLALDATPRLGRAILYAWLVAGTLDMADAVIWTAVHGRSPVRMMQGIAAGLIGKDAAVAGGPATAALGFATHYAIMAVMVTVFVLAASRLPALIRYPFLAGPIYGAGLYLVMYKIVLPWRFPGQLAPFNLASFVNQFLAHTCLVGLSMALVTAWALRRNPA